MNAIDNTIHDTDKPVDTVLLNQLRNNYLWDRVLQVHIHIHI